MRHSSRVIGLVVLGLVSASVFGGCVVRARPGVYVAPRPVYVAPRPVVVAQPQTVYVAQPQPQTVYVQQPQPTTVYVR